MVPGLISYVPKQFKRVTLVLYKRIAVFEKPDLKHNDFPSNLIHDIPNVAFGLKEFTNKAGFES
jgi:hypothetical protein